jgi:predicted short-subunit dehydrogenase-like oxidoreductase (DUF2520 family)
MQNTEAISSISIVGSGNVAWHLAQAFKAGGIKITNIISRSEISGNELADLVSSKRIEKLTETTEDPDLYLCCISDDSIGDVSEILKDKKSIIAHTSGSVSMDIFKRTHENYGVFYPLQTFTREKKMQYSGIPFLIEGSSKELENKFAKLADRVSGKWEIVNSNKRRMVHIAAVFACNFSNHLARIAQEILKEEKMDFDILRPLLEESNKKLQLLDPKKAQTGPAYREDISIIESHLHELTNKPEEAEIYKLLTDSIIKYKNHK